MSTALEGRFLTTGPPEKSTHKPYSSHLYILPCYTQHKPAFMLMHQSTEHFLKIYTNEPIHRTEIESQM